MGRAKLLEYLISICGMMFIFTVLVTYEWSIMTSLTRHHVGLTAFHSGYFATAKSDSAYPYHTVFACPAAHPLVGHIAWLMQLGMSPISRTLN